MTSRPADPSEVESHFLPLPDYRFAWQTAMNRSGWAEKPAIFWWTSAHPPFNIEIVSLVLPKGEDAMSYDPKAVANYFLDLADRDHRILSPMKIQKLIYYANGWCLAIKGQPLIDEQVEAWTFGPVIPSIYREFRAFGNQPIIERATDVKYEEKPDGSGYVLKCTTPSIHDDPAQAEYAKPILDRIWDVYGGYSAVQLSNLTHAKGSPWDQVATRYGGNWPRGTDIPIETIREYFTGLYAGGIAKS